MSNLALAISVLARRRLIGSAKCLSLHRGKSKATALHIKTNIILKAGAVIRQWTVKFLTDRSLETYAQRSKRSVTLRRAEEDFLLRTGNSRPEYQCIAANLVYKPGKYYWYNILYRTPDRQSALDLEKQLVEEYVRKFNKMPDGQKRPIVIW